MMQMGDKVTTISFKKLQKRAINKMLYIYKTFKITFVNHKLPLYKLTYYSGKTVFRL